MAAGLTQYRAYSTDEVLSSFHKFEYLRYDEARTLQKRVYWNVFYIFFRVLWQVMALLQQGNQNRTTEPTRANETSSRSHAILQVRTYTSGIYY